MTERLKIRDPFNPGMGPTRYLQNNDVFMPKDREFLKSKLKIKADMILQKQIKLAREAKEKQDREYKIHCKKNKDYYDNVKKVGRERTVFSPYNVDFLKERITAIEQKDIVDKRKSQILIANKSIKNMNGIPEHTFCTIETIKAQPYPEYKIALEHNMTLENMVATLKEENRIKRLIEKECDYIEKNFPVVAMHLAKKQEDDSSLILSGTISHTLRPRPSTTGNTINIYKPPSQFKATKRLEINEDNNSVDSYYKLGSNLG